MITFMKMRNSMRRLLKNIQKQLSRGYLSKYWIVRNLTHFILYLGLRKNYPPQKTVFFEDNRDRVDKIADLLADYESKKIYLGMIKYFSRKDKKDYPLFFINEEQYF